MLRQARNFSNLLGHQSALREPEEDFTVCHYGASGKFRGLRVAFGGSDNEMP